MVFGNLKSRFVRMSFDKKMKIFIFLSIGLTALIILLASTFSYVALMSRTSESLISKQIHTIASSLENALLSYKNTNIAFSLDDSVQQYLKSDIKTSAMYYEHKIKSRQSINNAMNMNPNINFIAIAKDGLLDAVYAGPITSSNSRFFSHFNVDLQNSTMVGLGLMRINFQSVYTENDPYDISVYQPIFDTSTINRQLGILCFNVREPALRQILDAQFETLNLRLDLVDSSGITVSSSEENRIGVKESYSSHLTHKQGVLRQGNHVVLYEKIGSSDYSIVGSIPNAALYKDGINTILLLIVAILLMAVASLAIGTRMVKNSYHTMGEIVTCMEDVSKGKMDVKMNENILGDDFATIAQGFNNMMLQLNNLMEQVKLEQHQIEQIKLNALHSQINPHFLYNTLECIHWQAVMDGSKEISRIVKALAAYYRLCLSKGKDIIDLSTELEHIRSYLTIQNERYGNIVECDIQIDSAFHFVQIPKMTLQPLVENSIYHGIKIKDSNSGNIIITAKNDGDTIIITIQDNGSGMEQEKIDEINGSISIYDENFGYGVRNVHKRIELTFGKGFGLFYRASENGGVTVDIILPKIPHSKAGELIV